MDDINTLTAAYERGMRAAYEVSYVDWDGQVAVRTLGFAATDEEAADARRAEIRAYVKEGLRPTGWSAFTIATRLQGA